jgi:hypothetical protein
LCVEILQNPSNPIPKKSLIVSSSKAQGTS